MHVGYRSVNWNSTARLLLLLVERTNFKSMLVSLVLLVIGCVFFFFFTWFLKHCKWCSTGTWWREAFRIPALDLFTIYVCWVTGAEGTKFSMTHYIGGGGGAHLTMDGRCKIEGGLHQHVHIWEAGNCVTTVNCNTATNSCEVEVTHC